MVLRVIAKPVAAALAMSVALFTPSAALADDDVLVLEPATPWSIDYALDSCALRRTFAVDDQTVLMEMRQFAPNKPTIQFIIAGSGLRAISSGHPTRASLRYAPDAEEQKLPLVYGMSWENGSKGVTFSHSLDSRFSMTDDKIKELEARLTKEVVDQTLREREQAVTAIELHKAFKDDLRLETGSLGAPMTAMRKCLDELTAHWGIDVEAHRTLSKPLERLNFHRWGRVLASEYPEALLRLGEQGVLRVRLNVSEEGKATECNIQAQLADDEFRQSACSVLLKIAEYSPALDAQGNPIASYNILSIVYRIA